MNTDRKVAFYAGVVTLLLTLLMNTWLAYRIGIIQQSTGELNSNIVMMVCLTVPFALLIAIGSYYDSKGIRLGFIALLSGSLILILVLATMAFFVFISGGPLMALLIISPAFSALIALIDSIKAKRYPLI